MSCVWGMRSTTLSLMEWETFFFVLIVCDAQRDYSLKGVLLLMLKRTKKMDQKEASDLITNVCTCREIILKSKPVF